MITFIHTADIHFGMENYGKIDPKTGIHSRLLDFDRAVNYCVDYAIAQQVDFFLFSGDAYKTAHPTPTHQRLLFNCFLRLFKAGIPIVMVVGNHDNPLSFGKAHALEFFGQLPVSGFHVISKPTKLILSTKSGPVQIVGIPWPTRSILALKNDYMHASAQELTEQISAKIVDIIHHYAAQLDQNIPAVLAGHLTVSSGIFSGSEKRAIYGTDPLFFPSQLAVTPFDYVALGHLHRYQNLNPQGYPAIIYSGSPERIDFGERKEEKGFCHVTIHEKNKTTHEFIKTPTRTFIQLDVQLDESHGQTEMIINALRQYDLAGAVIKIIYYLPAHVKDRVDLLALQNFCSNAHYIVGIFPVRAPEIREKRLTLKVDMHFEELLNSYFATKPELNNRRDLLIKKTMELEAEISQKNEE